MKHTERCRILEVEAKPDGRPEPDALRLCFLREKGRIDYLTTRRSALDGWAPKRDDRFEVEYVTDYAGERKLLARRDGRKFWPSTD